MGIKRIEFDKIVKMMDMRKKRDNNDFIFGRNDRRDVTDAKDAKDFIFGLIHHAVRRLKKGQAAQIHHLLRDVADFHGERITTDYRGKRLNDRDFILGLICGLKYQLMRSRDGRAAMDRLKNMLRVNKDGTLGLFNFAIREEFLRSW